MIQIPCRWPSWRAKQRPVVRRLRPERSKIDIANLKAQLSCKFEMKDLGAAKKILSMEISRDRKSGLLFLS
jgi:hypothetical protein